MAYETSLHSKLVGWAKIVLPLGALAILSTLFLFARQTTDLSPDTLAEVEQIARDQRIEAPEFQGVTADGATVTVRAQSARPSVDSDQIVDITAVQITMKNAEGGEIQATATKGAMDTQDRIVDLTGLTRVISSNGYEMETNGLTADIGRGWLETSGLLEIRTPFGALTAGQMTANLTTGSEFPALDFTGGVRLLYSAPEVP